MSKHFTIPCAYCQKSVIFAEDPYRTPGATKYWKSTFVKPAEQMFIIQRQTPTRKKNGKVTIQTMHEYVLEVYCDANCGLAQYQKG